MKTIVADASRAPSASQITDIVMSAPVTDIHTHLYDPAFKDLLLWGIDDLLVYHYLVSESFRYHDLSYDKFWSLSKTAQADLIWDALFLQHSPVSEACRGVLTTLHALGLDVKKRDLPALAPLVREPDRGQPYYALHGASGLAEDLHDQFPLRRSGTPSLGEGVPPR